MAWWDKDTQAGSPSRFGGGSPPATATVQQAPSASGDPTRQAAWTQTEDLLGSMSALVQQARGTAAQNPWQLRPEDYDLSKQIFAGMGDVAANQMQQSVQDLVRQVTQEYANRGLSGSSFEQASVLRGQQNLQDNLFQMLNQARVEQSKYLQDLPTLKLQQNQSLYDFITSAANPMLNFRRLQLGVGPEFKKQDAASVIGQGLGAIGQIAGNVDWKG